MPKRRGLRFIRVVTRKHGETFAEEWSRASPDDAIDATKIMRWPDDRPSQLRYHEIGEEIYGRTFEAVKDAIAEAFVRIASEVLARERAVTNVPK